MTEILAKLLIFGRVRVLITSVEVADMETLKKVAGLLCKNTDVLLLVGVCPDELLFACRVQSEFSEQFHAAGFLQSVVEEFRGRGGGWSEVAHARIDGSGHDVGLILELAIELAMSILDQNSADLAQVDPGPLQDPE